MLERRRLTIFSCGNALLAAVMAVCFAVTVSRALGVFEFSWIVDLLAVQHGLVVGAFLVALEVQLTRRLLEPRDVLSREWLAGFVVEWGVLLAALLAGVWIWIGPRTTLQDLPRLAAMTAEVAARPEFLEGLVLLFVVWGLSRYLAVDLTAMESIPVSVLKESQHGVVQEQNAARNRLWQDVFFFGGIMVLLSVFSVPIANLAWGMPMNFGTLGLEILLFFLCGLGLFVIGRLMLLQMEWVTERTGIDKSVPRQWIGYGLAFVAILLVLAVALPTDYTFQLLTSVNLVVTGISTLLTALWLIIVFAIIWLLSLILPAAESTGSAIQFQLPEEELGESLPSLPMGISWQAVIREFLFWGFAVLIAIYVIRQIAPLRYSVLRRLRQTRFVRRLLDFLRRLKRRWVVWRWNAVQTIRETLDSLRQDRTGGPAGKRGGFLNLRGLDPRQSIRFYFFALLRRGAESGMVRRPAQTPREYLSVLSEREEILRGEFHELTSAFEESRYSTHALGQDDARRIRRVWDRIRTTLRAARGADGSPSAAAAGRRGGDKSE
jgi:hypothetical protein